MIPNPQWQKTTETPEDWESWRPIEIVHLREGWVIEVEGQQRGTVMPDLTSAHLWLQLLLQTPDLQNSQIKIAYSDRREVRD